MRFINKNLPHKEKKNYHHPRNGIHDHNDGQNLEGKKYNINNEIHGWGIQKRGCFTITCALSVSLSYRGKTVWYFLNKDNYANCYKSNEPFPVKDPQTKKLLK